MTGLGLLAPNHDQRGWHLRSLNVLSMIGSQHDVLAELIHAESRNGTERIHRAGNPAPPPDGTRAPLTAAQIDDLLGDHANQVRLVLGSPATRVDQVSATMREVCEDLADATRLIERAARKQFEDAPHSWQAGRAPRRAFRPGRARARRTKAAPLRWQPRWSTGRQPGRDPVGRARRRTRADPVLAGDLRRRGAAGPGHGRVRRPRQARDARLVARHRALHRAGAQARLLEITGGWPHLTERAVTLAEDTGRRTRRSTSWPRNCDRDGAAELVDAVGFGHDQTSPASSTPFWTTRRRVPASKTYWRRSACPTTRNPKAALSCLEALALFDAEEDRSYSVERLVARCWPHRRPIANDE